MSLFAATFHLSALGGGSGLNVVVVVNQNSQDSVRLGNYYCERRGVPPQNLVRITNWFGGRVVWTNTDFESCLRAPLQSLLVARGLTNQIDFVVLCMDIPYRVTATNGDNSTTSAMFYGFKTNDCPGCPYPGCTLPSYTSNAYAGSEDIFRNIPQFANRTNTFLVTMLTSSNLSEAMAIVDRGVASDSTFPTQQVVLGNNQMDPFRTIRHVLYDDAIFNARLRGNYNITRDNSSQPLGQTNLLGYQNGMYRFGILPNTFVPGAIADSLTSFGGRIYEPNDHTTLLAFLDAGATASYGTIIEPCAYLEKFPTPHVYFYQARGFNIAESYYQSVTNPYQGLIVGEPLAAPFAKPGAGQWINLPDGAILAGITNLTVQFTAADPTRPIQQVDLFLDGLWIRTLTNIVPSQGNRLFVTIEDRTAMYSVGPNASIKSVASNLAATLNSAPFTNQVKVRAFARGDRIELQSTDLARPGVETALSVSNAIGTGSALTTYIHASGTNFMDTLACGARYRCTITNTAATISSGDFLRLVVIKTNGQAVTVAVTNNFGATSLWQLAEAWVNAVNANTELQSSDGVAIENPRYSDKFFPADKSCLFNIRARAAGWAAAQVQVALQGSTNFVMTPAGTNALTENVSVLAARAHIYVTVGVTNLTVTFPFNTWNYADGHHELIAVAYEGSHVRTQTRATRQIVIKNSSAVAELTCTPCASNTAVEATLQFSVAAGTNSVARIELFSTGGLIGVVSNQQTAAFSVSGTNLGLGLHPFYAVVSYTDGKQYRTQTKWIRLIGPDEPFRVGITAPPPVLRWHATAGRRYEVLAAEDVTDNLQMIEAIVPTNSVAEWTDTNDIGGQRFYRVRAVH
ncbi:MAG: TIGR03790 family protein [Verrucomicrobiae bacterium]|nr:TIGR03790 family protein [Verrucomicrobiae bacterium]